jgi:iron complex transport system substrate-binding protein
MRICSLVPGVTEIVAALGLADRLVGVSHECDYPDSVRHVPVMIEPVVGREPAFSRDIDGQVKQLAAAGRRLYRLNEDAFRRARPDLILTQDLCHVCAVTPDQLAEAIRSLPSEPLVLTFSPSSLTDVLNDVKRVAQAVGWVDRGEAIVRSLKERLDRIAARVSVRPRPRLACLEWLDPLYVAGHWVPEMVELAGGQDVLGVKHAPSRETTWQAVAAARPDILAIMPCGYSVDRTMRELGQADSVRSQWSRAGHLGATLYAVDAASYFSRPGPRLVDGVELLADILHPDPRRPLDPARAVTVEPAALAMESPT